MTLLPHKSLLLTQTRDPPTAQIITFDTNASPSYRTNHHLWRKNVTLIPHKSSLLTQKRDPPTAQITTFDTNTWSSYRTTHHFWHECVTLLPHKSSLFTQKRDPHTAQMSNFDTFYWCLRVVLQVIVVVWSYICRSYDKWVDSDTTVTHFRCKSLISVSCSEIRAAVEGSCFLRGQHVTFVETWFQSM